MGGDTTSPCNWTAITCNNLTNQIISIDFTDFTTLAGPFPADFCRISSLRTPYESLSLQIGIDLSSNFFSGKSGTSNYLSELTKFVAPENLFTGPLPEAIGRLKKLQIFRISDTQMSGKIPESIVISVKYLMFWYFELILIEFDASQNNLTGKLPASLVGLHLKSLAVNDNKLEGEISNVLASNPNLTQLKLFNNSFSGVLPERLGEMSDLEEFDVSGNMFEGLLPVNLCYQKKLQKLVCFNNRLSGGVPAAYGDCKSVYYIWMSNNEFSGYFPVGLWSSPEIGNLPVLNYLDLAENSLSGQDLKPFPDATS
ncbi:LRR receptor-like serine/threonine-protein kinase HSL2 [Tanacetum coccineum]